MVVAKWTSDEDMNQLVSNYLHEQVDGPGEDVIVVCPEAFLGPGLEEVSVTKANVTKVVTRMLYLSSRGTR